VHYVPHGVESDIFHPWGPVQRFSKSKTYLWFGQTSSERGSMLF
jgi:hypothetical protein